MTDDELKSFWYPAYANALKMLMHPESVTVQMIAYWTRKYKSTVLSRLFCLVVWQETKRIREGSSTMNKEQYKEVVTEVWRLFKEGASGNNTDEFWDNLVERMQDIMRKYAYCDFIRDLVCNVTLETIEQIHKQKGKDTA